MNTDQIWRNGLRQIIDSLSPLHRWAPILSAVIALMATFMHSQVLRTTTAGVALILFVIVAVDVSRALLEPDRGPYNPLRNSPVVRINWFQVALAGFLALVYTFLILSTFQGLISIVTMPAVWANAIIFPAIFIVAMLVAWRNVRLWAYEATEYEELLKERENELAEKEKLKKMRLPSSFWEHPKI